MTAFTLGPTQPDDLAQIMALYPRAFPDEDLRTLVTDLLALSGQVLSFAAYAEDQIIGHILFAHDSARQAALLGPLAVDPDYQRSGVGTALIAHGLAALNAARTHQVFVLGDPKYYSRAGFVPERTVMPPYPLPAAWTDAWQSLCLPGRLPLRAGQLDLPEPWMNPAYWQ